MKIFATSIFLVFLFFQQAASAQKIIKLNNAPFTVRNRNFNITEVLDARADASKVGIVQLYGAPRKEVAIIARGLAESIQLFLNNSLEQLPENHSILLKITRFGIGDEYTSKYKPYLPYLKADFKFYALTDSGYYEVFVQQHRLKASGSEGESNHEALIRLALNKSLNNLVESGWEKKLKELPLLSPEEVAQPDAPPILSTGECVKGIYQTFEEYRNNRPSITNIQWKENRSGIRKLTYVNEKNETVVVKPVSTFWGFSDGKMSFIKQYNHYYQLQQNRKGIYFSTARSNRARSSLAKGVFSAGAFMGLSLVGSGIASGVATGLPNGQGLFQMDVDTGEYMPVR